MNYNDKNVKFTDKQTTGDKEKAHLSKFITTVMR